MRQYIGACGALVPPVHWLTCAEVNCYGWCISALMHLVHWYIGALTYGSVLTVDALVHWCIGTLLHMVHLVRVECRIGSLYSVLLRFFILY